MKKLFSLITAVGIGLMANCGIPEQCYDRNYQSITSYDVVADRYTPKGIGLDDPKNDEWKLDADEIDWQVDNLESCLNERFAENPVLSEESNPTITFDGVTFQNCTKNEFYEPIKIKRGCLTVKVPDDLYESQCSDQWLFPCDANPQGCLNKGLEIDPVCATDGSIGPTEVCPCPCNCRATVQNDNYIITNHILNVFRAELTRIVTTCADPWIVEQFRGCLSPNGYDE